MMAPTFEARGAPRLRAADLLAVVNFYDAHFVIGLSPQQKADLVEFLKSL
jgi:hypothetical protein